MMWRPSYSLGYCSGYERWQKFNVLSLQAWWEIYLWHIYHHAQSRIESGAVKIQNGNENELTCAEKNPVRTQKTSTTMLWFWRRNERAINGDDIFARLTKCRKVEQNQDEHINCHFILWSVALIESLWSTAEFICTNLRSRMSPKMFELLLVLMENVRFWDAALFSQAIKMEKQVVREES